MSVRLRYAPSPTGHLHIGGARTALFNYLYAKQCKGEFILRIEDTDLLRQVDSATEEFAENLRWLGIEWDEGVDLEGPYGPYRCTERLPIYTQHVEMLRQKGRAYDCFCTEEELAQAAEVQVQAGQMPHYSGKCRHLTDAEKAEFRAQGRTSTVRLRVPDQHTVTFTDLIRGDLSFDTQSTGGDYRIVKSNGIPVYNFAVVVDDHLMEITHVIRGEEHISNTPRQLYLYEAFGWTPPLFGHVSLILGENGKKLSKRDESIVQFIEQYKEMGYLPEAIFNFLALLGWSPEGEQEILSKEDLIAQFSLERLSKSGAFFDAVKLSWMNGHYIKERNALELLPLAQRYLQPFSHSAPWSVPTDWQLELLSLYQDQLHALSELPVVAQSFLQEFPELETDALATLQTDVAVTVVRALVTLLENWQGGFTAEDVKGLLKELQSRTNVKGKELFMPVRAAVTGQLHGKDLNRTFALLGRDLVGKRAHRALVFLRDSE